MLDEAPRIHAVPRPGSARLRAERAAGGLRCPFCHEAPGEQERVSVCRACFAPHHAPCWDEHGACSVCGNERRVGGRNAALATPAPRGAPPVPPPLLAILSVPLALLAALVGFAALVLVAMKEMLGAAILGSVALLFGAQVLCNLFAFHEATRSDREPPPRSGRGQ